MVILIAEDEPSIRRALELLLKAEHEIILCCDGSQALMELSRNSVDLVITDFQMPLVSGLELIRRGKAMSPSTAFILMTAFGSTNQAVEAIQLGADDYFNKPFDVSEMKHRIRKIEELRSYKIEKALSAEEVVKRLIGDSPAMQAIRKFVTASATSTSPVFLRGPRGAGKEFIARSIHDTGQRSIYPFIILDCSTTDASELEMELFGFEKDKSQKGAIPKPGKLELARGGTLFLTEIAAMSMPIQTKLATALREGSFCRVGSSRPLRCSARLIVSSQEDLRQLVDQEQFLGDLFYQLCVLTLEIPGLSQRAQDLPLLIDHFWEKVIRDVRADLTLAPETRELLAKYPFPGNIRELRNVLERLAVVGSATRVITPELLPSEFRLIGLRNSPDKNLDEQIAEFERHLILDTLHKTAGDTRKSAEALGLTADDLKLRMERHGLQKTPRKQAA